MSKLDSRHECIPRRLAGVVVVLSIAALFGCAPPTATGPDFSGRYVLRSVNGVAYTTGNDTLTVSRDEHWSETGGSFGTWLQADSIVSLYGLLHSYEGYYGRITAVGLDLQSVSSQHHVFARVP